LGPPSDLRWPPENADAAAGRKVSRWTKVFAGLGVIAIAVGLSGTFIRVPYDTLAPGGTLNLETRVSVKGTKTYAANGDVMLLFVRERAHVNLWSWLQAKLDPDIDLVKQERVTGGSTQQQADRQDVCDMSQSQNAARVAALTALGEPVPVLPGLSIFDLPAEYATPGPGKTTILHKFPAIQVLRPCDLILSVDGKSVKAPADLSKAVKAHKAGTDVVIGILRDGHNQTVHVPVIDANGTSLIGVSTALRYKIPLNISLDTSDVSGPSAGLAMALAIIDVLTPGELTGGKPVAVTGTIDPEGNVGEIGGLPQKAVVARTAGAKIFIVPACSDDSCRQDLATARKRVGKNVELRTVSTLAEALKVLHDAGGAPVPVPVAS
jgi:PDZ domain-containing protein